MLKLWHGSFPVVFSSYSPVFKGPYDLLIAEGDVLTFIVSHIFWILVIEHLESNIGDVGIDKLYRIELEFSTRLPPVEPTRGNRVVGLGDLS
jgi:hypothetical protein